MGNEILRSTLRMTGPERTLLFSRILPIRAELLNVSIGVKAQGSPFLHDWRSIYEKKRGYVCSALRRNVSQSAMRLQ